MFKDGLQLLQCTSLLSKECLVCQMRASELSQLTKNLQNQFNLRLFFIGFSSVKLSTKKRKLSSLKVCPSKVLGLNSVEVSQANTELNPSFMAGPFLYGNFEIQYYRRFTCRNLLPSTSTKEPFPACKINIQSTKTTSVSIRSSKNGLQLLKSDYQASEASCYKTMESSTPHP